MLSGIAKVCLEEGNKEYRQGEANNAINSYTEGLQVNCKDKRLNAKLYSNRATAHFRLGNNLILNIEIAQAELQDSGIQNVHQEKEKIEQLQKRSIGRVITL